MIAEGKTIQFHYTLTVDSKVVDSSAGAAPMTYLHGGGEIIPGLESQLVGLKVGDKKEVVVAAADGYGVHNPEAVQTVPKSLFTELDGLEVGRIVDGEADGQPFQATVLSIAADTVELDFNHPFAGKELHFSIEIVAIH